VPHDAVRGGTPAPRAADRAERRRERLGVWGVESLEPRRPLPVAAISFANSDTFWHASPVG
jgi:hypothetical protein